MALTAKQKAFVEHYLACGMNATAAARKVSPKAKRPDQVGYEYLRKPEIAEAIKARLEALAMPAAEVLARLSNQARGDMGDFLRVDEEEVTLSWSLINVPTDADGLPNVAGLTLDLAMMDTVKPTDRVLATAQVKRASARLDMLTAGQAGRLHLVKKYSLDKEGKVTIELYDAQKALELLAKHHKLLGDDGGILKYIDLTKLNDDQLTRIANGDDPVAVLLDRP